MVMRRTVTAMWLLFVIASNVSALEFRVKVPRSFETEVFVEERYGERFDTIQFQISEVEFYDFENYRIRSFSATTVKRDLVEEGLNLLCGESETIVVGGQLLSLARQSDRFRGSIPTSREILESMLDENCRNIDWNVSFASKVNSIPNSLERLPSLGIIFGSLDLLSADKTAFSVPQIKNKVFDNSEINFRTNGNEVNHSASIIKLQDGWRVSKLESTFSNPRFVRKYTVQEQDSELVLDSSFSKNENGPESRAKARMRNIQLDGYFPIVLGQRIANGTPVSLKGSPQIKAVWMDGKIVRVYEGGTVDDLGSATFQTNSVSYGIAKILLITFGFACIGSLLMWILRSRAKVM